MTTSEKREVTLPQGKIHYRDLGEGPTIVFVHGYLVDGRLWDRAAEDLAKRGFRCLVPDWPMGAQRTAMDPNADLSPPGVATIISDFLAALDLDRVTIVGNDSGGAMSQVLVTTRPERIARLVLTNCDTHENFPPGIFRVLPPLAKLPGAIQAMALPFRVPALGRLAFAPFAASKIPAETIASWFEPSLRDPAVRRDLQKVTVGMHRRHTLAAAEALRSSQLPILLAWAPGDRFFPIKYAERLVGEAGNARLVRIPDSKTFVSIDQPARLAAEISQFAETA